MKSVFAKDISEVRSVVRENVEWFFSGTTTGIKSSDVTSCAKAVLGNLYNDANIFNYNPTEVEMLCNAIHNEIYELTYN